VLEQRSHVNERGDRHDIGNGERARQGP
jgi:hypothetical protein